MIWIEHIVQQTENELFGCDWDMDEDRFYMKFIEDGTWAIFDRDNKDLPYAWFTHDFKAKMFLDYENNNWNAHKLGVL